MKNKVSIAILSAVLLCGAGPALALEIKAPSSTTIYNTPTGTVTTTMPGTTVSGIAGGTYTIPGKSDTTTSAATTPAASTNLETAVVESVAAGAASALSGSVLPATGATITLSPTGSTNKGLLGNMAGAGTGTGSASAIPTWQQTRQNLTGASSVYLADSPNTSGTYDPEKCAELMARRQASSEQRYQQQIEPVDRASVPSTEALSCTAANQAIMANAFMDIFQSRGMQNKVFSLIGKDATKFFSDIGMPEGLGMQLIGQLGNTLVKALGIDRAISSIAGSLGNAIGGALGVSVGVGPSHIQVSAQDCKLMEQVSKPPCAISVNSPIRQKNSDGTAAKCIDYQAMSAIMGIASGAISGGSGVRGVTTGLWNAVGGAISTGLANTNAQIDAQRAAAAASVTPTASGR